MQIIDIIAPSSKNDKEISKQQIELLFKKINIKARIAENFIDKSCKFTAAEFTTRLDHLVKAMQADDSKIIWAYRGGYGSMELIPSLPKELNHDKILIGFSDITALHIYFNQQLNLPSIHANMCARLVAKNNITEIEEILSIANGNTKQLDYAIQALNKLAIDNHIEAELIGGNLAVIQYSLGTNWQIDTNNKILFLEDIGERGYRIRAILEQFKQVGLIDNLQAIIFGEFTEGLEDDGRDLKDYAINEFAAKCHIPVYKIKNIGHVDNNKPLILGVKTIIEQNKMIIKNPF